MNLNSWQQSVRACALCLLISGCAFQPQLPPADHSDKPVISANTDPVPRPEPLSRYGNPKSYEQFGRRYHIMESATGYAERGIASWYGPKFHGKRTSSGEPYDMYAMTAAHKTLPIPTWVRVTNLKNQSSVLVRVNDRGPFVENRIIDLSHEAARRLDMIREGTGLVDVRVLEFDAAGNFSVARTPVEPSTVVVMQSEPTLAPDSQPAAAVASTPAQPVAMDADVQQEPMPQAVVESSTPPTSAPSDHSSVVNLYAQVGAFSNIDNAERLYLRLRDSGVGRIDILDLIDQVPRLFRVRVGPVHDSASYDQMVAELNALGIDKVTLVIEAGENESAAAAEN